MTLLRPRALRSGDTVAVLCASSPVEKPANLQRGLAALRSVGLVPEVLGTAEAGGTVYDYLAGTDAERAADLTTALVDPRYAAVLLACGGYGSQRTLELVDWAAVAARATPKVVCGYSDVTALLEAVAVKLGWVSLFGPMVACGGFYEGPGEYDFDELMKLLFTPSAVPELAFPDARTLTGGVAEGLTLGGTATLLAASIGTDTSRPARDAILFLEDVDELPYRLDRCLTQIRRSSYLHGVAGLVLGTFTECGDPAQVDRLLAERFGDLGVPVLAGVNIGHNTKMQTYPVGVRARLDADRRTLTFLDRVLEDHG